MTAHLKFFVDVGVGKKVEQWLSENGYDVKPVRAIDPMAADSEILAWARNEGRMVITMDKDFGELVYNCGHSHAGVLVLRMEDADSIEKAGIIKDILVTYADRIQNKFCVFQNGRLRIKH